MSGLALGAKAEPPALGWPTIDAGPLIPGAFGPEAAPGRLGAVPPGGVVPGSGASFALGLGRPGGRPIALGGTGGAPLMPGTGSALAFGNAWPGGNALGDTFVGTGIAGAAFRPDAAPGVPGFTAGLIEALGGTGSFPCWISEARCATAGGNAGPAPGDTAGRPAFALDRPPTPGTTGPGGGGRLMTLLITVVLWILVKMMLFRGGTT